MEKNEYLFGNKFESVLFLERKSFPSRRIETRTANRDKHKAKWENSILYFRLSTAFTRF